MFNQTNFSATPSDQALIEALLQRLSWTGIDCNGKVRFFENLLVSREALQRVVAEKRFAELVAKSDQPAFVIERSFDGTKCQKTTPIGKAFYALSQLPSKPNLPDYRFSEEVELTESIVTKLGLDTAKFTENPLLHIGGNDLREGDLVNTFIQHLRLEMRKKIFLKQQADRQKEIQLCLRRVSHLFIRLQENQPLLQAVDCDLGYAHAHQTSLSNITHDLTQLLEHLANYSDTTPTVGHFWFLTAIPEIGFRARLVLFTYRNDFPDQHVLNVWQELTNNHGVGTSIRVPNWGLEQLKKQLRVRIACDAFMQIKTKQDEAHWCISDIPRKSVPAPEMSPRLQQDRYFRPDY